MTPFEVGMLMIAGLTLVVNVARILLERPHDDDSDKDKGEKEE